MKRSNALLICVITIIYSGCSQTTKQNNDGKQNPVVQTKAANQSPTVDTIKNKGAENAKEWLLYSIKHRYKDNGGEDTSVNMYTKQYSEYKTDAINREFDGLTEKQFIDKWKDRYNTKFAGQNSVLIGQQDWTKPRVTSCILKNKISGNAFVFSVVIEDSDTESKYIHKRDIKVIRYKDTFLIDDILDYD